MNGIPLETLNGANYWQVYCAHTWSNSTNSSFLRELERGWRGRRKIFCSLSTKPRPHSKTSLYTLSLNRQLAKSSQTIRYPRCSCNDTKDIRPNIINELDKCFILTFLELCCLAPIIDTYNPGYIYFVHILDMFTFLSCIISILSC